MPERKKSLLVDRKQFEDAVKKVLRADPLTFKDAKTGQKKKSNKVIPAK